jgi:hypothetical protein
MQHLLILTTVHTTHRLVARTPLGMKLMLRTPGAIRRASYPP